MPRILVVDDDFGVQESLRMLLKEECEVVTADGVDAALTSLDAGLPDLILLDLVMPVRNGMELLREMHERALALPVIVLTATKTVATAVEAMQLGALDYVTKPFEVEALRLKVRRILEQRALEDEVLRLRDEVSERSSLGDLVGRSPAMREVFRTVERVARKDASVLITGESGTGKELVAKAVHDLSPRKGPFVAVSCAAMPVHLIENELFGHEKGAYTGADQKSIGRIESAEGGTLFLDEVGEYPPEVQVKLLRVLQERSIERLGTHKSIDVDVRIVAATNRNLKEEIEKRRFREDLFFRLAVVPIELPPLRARREDVRLLAEHLLAKQAAGDEPEHHLDAHAMAALEAYAWPGNVRELENVLERAAALADGQTLSVEDLGEEIVRSGGLGALREEVRTGSVGFEDAVTRFETDLLRDALERYQWNQTHAAEQLGITRRLLKIKMDKLGLLPPD